MTNFNLAANMKRLLIFGLLGPAMGFLVLCLLDGSRAGDLFAAWSFVLPIVYGIEVIPLLLCALIDFYLDEARSWQQLGVAALAGFSTTVIALLVVTPSAMNAPLQLLKLGLVGAVPALACSWLIRRTREPNQ